MLNVRTPSIATASSSSSSSSSAAAASTSSSPASSSASLPSFSSGLQSDAAGGDSVHSHRLLPGSQHHHHSHHLLLQQQQQQQQQQRVEEDHFPIPKARARSATYHRSWSHHNLLLKSEQWSLPFQYNRVHFFDYNRDEVGIDEHVEAGGLKSTRSKGLVLNVISALRGAMNEAAERRRHYHESVSRWQRFLHHSLKNPQPVSRVRMLRAIESKKLRSRGREDAPVEIVFVRHCEGNHNAMKSVGMGT